MKITLEALITLESITRTGSYALAAKELHKVPSALTYTINKLESDLDLELFSKNGRKMVLTPSGKEFTKQSNQLLTQAKLLQSNASLISSGWESEFRIAINDIVPDKNTLGLIDKFYQTTDSTNIHLTKEILSGSWDALLSNRVDLIIGAPQYFPPADFVVKDFCDLEFVFAVNKKHVLAQQKHPISDEQIKQFKIAVVSDSNRSFETMSFDIFKDQKTITFPTHHLKNNAQISGLCIGSVAKHLVIDQLKSGELIIKDIESSKIVGKHSTYFAYRKDHKGKALEWFIAELNEISLKNQWFN